VKPAGIAALLCVAAAIALPWALRRLLPAAAFALPVAINLALATWFASTLRRGHEPMIARFARAERGTLEHDLVPYARRLTWIWVGFFIAAAAVAAVLASTGHFRAWLFFTSVGNYAAAAALFVGEYWWRRRRYAHYHHASPQVLWTHVANVLRRRGS
jgi:uncharacterized membrane protein